MFKFTCCLARFLHEPTSPKQDKQTIGGSTPGMLVPSSSITDRERRDQKEGRSTEMWLRPLHKAAPTDRSSLSPQEASPVTSHSSIWIKEDHSTCAAPTWVSRAFILSTWPPVSFLLPWWKRRRREQGVSSFPSWGQAIGPKVWSPDQLHQ